MRYVLIAVAIMVVCTCIADAGQTANPWATGGVYTPTCARPADLQEDRIFSPTEVTIDKQKATMLAKRLFVAQLVGCSRPVWSPLPYPSVVIQTYSLKPIGDAFVKIDEAHGQWRPGYTWWADKDMTMGAHMEQCVAGNLVFSLFVCRDTAVEYKYIDRLIPHEKVVEVLKRVYEPYIISQPVPARQFICPAGVTGIYTPAMPMSTGSTSVGQWHDLMTLYLYQVPELKLPQTPDSPYCPPGGEPPPEPPPGNTNPPNTPPPPGDGDGWGGPNQPPDQPTPPGVDGQPWEPDPPPAS